MEWLPVSAMPMAEVGTLAELKMPSGKIIIARWEVRQGMLAWWPNVGEAIGSDDPHSWRPIDRGPPMAEIIKFPARQTAPVAKNDGNDAA